MPGVSLSALLRSPAARTVLLALPGLAFLAFSAPVAAHARTEGDSLVGQWERRGGTFVVIYLPDGRCATWDKRSYLAPHSVHKEVGTYTVDGDTVRANWLISGAETLKYHVDGNTLTFQTKLFPITQMRTGGADEAARTYAEIEADTRRIAEDAAKKTPVGPVQRGAIRVNGIPPDRLAGDVFAGAMVYRSNIEFGWVPASPRQYRPSAPDDPGITYFRYVLLPNGRFFFDGWLHDLLMDEAKPFNENNPADLRGRTVSARHWQCWGRYRVTPGRNILDPDTVELVRDNGQRETMLVVDGHLYMRPTGPSTLLMSNAHLLRQYYKQTY